MKSAHDVVIVGGGIELNNDTKNVAAIRCEDCMTMVCVTHKVGFAKTVADTMVFMDNGAIVEAAPPASVRVRGEERPWAEVPPSSGIGKRCWADYLRYANTSLKRERTYSPHVTGS